mmetsp:Transcript_39289/g.65205  ORF Transcript_39289/g.65205 Transcript_39289/m.65205 type:complete len:83 (-) Transcript_39289:794-1042(-)
MISLIVEHGLQRVGSARENKPLYITLIQWDLRVSGLLAFKYELDGIIRCNEEYVSPVITQVTSHLPSESAEVGGLYGGGLLC